MASGDVAAIIFAAVQPGTLYTTPSVIVGAASPAESIPVFDFDDTTEEYIDYHGIIVPNATLSGGLQVRFKWGATVTTGTAVLGGAFRAVPDDAEDLDTTAHSYSYQNTGALTPPSAVGEVAYDNLSFTSGQIDGVAAGEQFILRVRRVPGDASDTMSGDLRLHGFPVILEA